MTAHSARLTRAAGGSGGGVTGSPWGVGSFTRAAPGVRGSLLVDRQVVGRDAQDEDGDGGLVRRAVGGLAAGVVPFATRTLVAGTQERVAHPLVILLPHLAADLV